MGLRYIQLDKWTEYQTEIIAWNIGLNFFTYEQAFIAETECPRCLVGCRTLFNVFKHVSFQCEVHCDIF